MVAILLTLGVLAALVLGAYLYMEKQAAKAEAERLRHKESLRRIDNDIWSTGVYSDVKIKNLRRAARNADAAQSYGDYYSGEKRQ